MASEMLQRNLWLVAVTASVKVQIPLDRSSPTIMFVVSRGTNKGYYSVLAGCCLDLCASVELSFNSGPDFALVLTETEYAITL